MNPPVIKNLAPTIKGADVGICNICLKHAKLSFDHVPPKGVAKVSQANLFRIGDMLDAQRPLGKPAKARHMQDGVKYKSICEDCNNLVLGTKCDPTLIEFSNSITRILQSKIHIPNPIYTRTKPGILARSVLGHLLAADINRDEQTPLLNAIRHFVLHDDAPLPDGIEVHYWLYPYRRQIILRDACLIRRFFAENITFWCLKFFPVGFMVTFDNDHPYRMALPNLRDFMINSGGHEANIPIFTRNVRHQFWPEAPEDDGAVLYGEAAYGALPKEDIRSP